MRKRRVLIYDDEVNILKLLKEFFSNMDYEVQTFDSPVVCSVYEKDLDSCANSKPCTDILITDYKMPKITGLELLRQQTQRGCKVDIRNKAIMSGNLDDETLKEIRELGYTLFSKPFKLTELAAWIDDCESRIDLFKEIGIMRKEERHPANIEIEYICDASENIYRSSVMNLSNTGLCLKIPAPLSEGQSIMFKTDLPNNCRKAFVRWVRKIEASFYLAGFSCC